ncbi:MAG: DAK2 domain-containing protein [Candidatus Nanopelagicales bacterium]|jgi:uncharacterized protein
MPQSNSRNGGPPISGITLPILHSWLFEAQSALRVAREEIDALNVFPVPDGDTGTNLYLTVEAACGALLKPGDDLGQAAQRVGRAAIMGARGNSGVILSAFLRDLVAELANSPENFARALSQGSRGAYKAVANPLEGTILTVASRSAQEASNAAAQGADLIEVVSAAAETAYATLLLTPELLVQLREAGVVDAGGRGLVVVLDSLVKILTGTQPQRTEHAVQPFFDFPRIERASSQENLPAGAFTLRQESARTAEIECEVMYHFEATDCSQLQKSLEAVGSSVMVAGIDSTWNVHVHVPLHRVADCVNAGLGLGQVSQVSVTQLEINSVVQAHADLRPLRSRILIAVTHGEGVRQLLESLGVMCIPTPARQQPSAAEIIAATQGCEASEIVILPADRDTHPVADIAAADLRNMGYRVSVIPSRAITQSLAAIAVNDPEIDFDRDVVAMTRAAGATRYGAITRATRDVLTMAGECKSGDYLGLIGGEINSVDHELTATTQSILTRMLAPGAELLTIVTGSEASELEVDTVLGWVREHYPLVELELVFGEQPLWPFIFGAE